jgi:23S rRNA pseudouridine955/2504/2580 synthase
VRVCVPKTRRDLDMPWGDLLPLEVAHAGHGWVVVEKPAGVPSHPGGGVIKRTLLTAAGVAFREACDAGGPWLPHRLDRETSGLTVVALRGDALARFAAAFRAGRIRRFYRALLRGRLAGRCEWIDLRFPLREVGHRPKRVAVDPAGVAAHTRLRVLTTSGDATEVELEPVTGRQHQLRVHAAHLGHPIAGDPLYDPRGHEGERMRLHACELEIPADVAGAAAPVVVTSRRALEGVLG